MNRCIPFLFVASLLVCADAAFAQAPRFRSPEVPGVRQNTQAAGASNRSEGTPSPREATRKLARLVRNPSAQPGEPAFALADQQGQIQRLVRSEPGIALDQFVDEVVVVTRDSGRILTASSLELPEAPPARLADQRATPIPTARQEQDRQVVATQFAAGEDPENLPGPEPPRQPLAPTRAIAEEQILTPSSSEPVLHSHTASPAPVHASGEYLLSDVSGGPDDSFVCNSPSCNGCPQCAAGGYGYGNSNYQGWRLLEPYNECGPRGCQPGARGRFYVRGEYLLWHFDGMEVPPLIVRGDPEDPDGTPGTGDEFLNNARVTFGGNDYLGETRDGFRWTLGMWLDQCGFYGIEGDYLTFDTAALTTIDSGADGDAEGLGRPFFAIPPGENRIEDVFFPNEIQGSVRVDLSSDFEGAGLRIRHNLCCLSGGGCGCGDVVCGGTVCGAGCGSCCGSGACQRNILGTRRVDMTVGLRYLSLDERIAIQENLETLPLPATTTFIVNDIFSTQNNFVGGEIGFNWLWDYHRWSLDLLSRLAIGNTHSKVSISGNTIRDGNTTFNGGLLTQEGTNIGYYSDNEFSVVPEVGLNLGYMLTKRLQFRIGYSLLYWSNVMRPGDQIDLDVNPDLIPRDTPPANPAAVDRPRALLETTDIWAYGITSVLNIDSSDRAEFAD